MTRSVAATSATHWLQWTVLAGLVTAITAAAGARLVLVFRQNINWDEFFFLSQVHDHLRGSLSLPFQTIHVHLFQWLPLFAENEVDQIIIARLVYFGLSAATSGLLYAIGRRFFGVAASLFIVLCYLAYGEVLTHGNSFRTDGLASFLFVAAAHLLLRARRSFGALMTSGLLTGLMLLATVKSVFYLPTCLAVLTCSRSQSLRTSARSWAVWLVSAAASFGVLFSCHRAGLAEQSVGTVARFTEDSWTRFLLHTKFFPGLNTFLSSFNDNVVVWISIISGSLLLLERLRDRNDTSGAAVLLWFLVPMASLLVYRNAFPYFYVFLMPPSVLVAGAFFQRLVDWERDQSPRSAPLVALTAVLGVSASLLLGVLHLKDSRLDGQRQVLQTIHQIFPAPVPYVDRNSMVASFPKVGFFMSTLGIDDYRRTGSPRFDELLRNEHPLFVVANHPALQLHASNADSGLRPEDRAILRQNFVHHWGPVYVAGKRFQAGLEQTPVEIVIPGPYTVEAPESVEIDGRSHETGNVVSLETGVILVRSPRGQQPVVLRWGRHLHRPSTPAPSGPIYDGL